MDDRDTTRRFYALIWPYRSVVLRIAQILVGDVHEAEDLAQETMIKAFRALDGFQDGSDAKRWLMAILRNARIDRWRASSPNEVSLDRLKLEPADSDVVSEQTEWNEPQDVLNQFGDQEIIRALQELSEELRWTLLLVDVEGLDHAEAATILDVPVGTIKSRTHRGRALLRQALLPIAKDRRMLRD